MVGVRGKYKGCETCRARRVKCDNERPYCRKCIDSGRECAGYEREMVFITATIDDGGRCSSHPPRQVSSSKKSPKAKAAEQTAPRLAPTEPLTPAWDDLISLSENGVVYSVQIATLHARLQNVLRGEEDRNRFSFPIAFPPYLPIDVETWDNGGDTDLAAQNMISLLPAGNVAGPPDGICAFLFEDKIILALLHRKATFLSSFEWCTIPWEMHPKSIFDRLFDVIVHLPGIFARVDRTIPFAATLQRRLKAQELLSSCLQVEQQLEEWHTFARSPTLEHPYAYWIEESDDQDAQQVPFANPFAENFAFKDGVTAVMFLYYWMTLLLLHRCIESLHHAIFQPVIEDFPNMYPDLPPHLQINLARYQQRREFAARVCRALDFALNTTVQPDLLVAPLATALEFYRELNSSSRDGELEIMWCEGFKLRLASKGQDIANVLQSRQWADLARF
ncbi:Aspercryptin biosynthesis cluster-specific transcription regulator atnN [Colletotrichum sp. SAR11_59]|nr:Aspercryptin biosynthesis cluster-specific transcription regulator atnN [Colletotrichum sp. SAR11_59]